MRIQKIADKIVKSFEDKNYFHQEQVLDSGDSRPKREPYLTPSKISDEHIEEIANEVIKNLDDHLLDFNKEVALESALELTIRDFQDGLYDGKIDAENFLKLKKIIQDKKSYKKASAKYKGDSMKTASYYTSQIDKIANEIRELVVAGELSPEQGYALELGLDEVSDEIEKEESSVSPSDNKQASTVLKKPASYYTSQIDKIANEIRELVVAGELTREDGYAFELGLDEVSDEIEKEASALEHDADEKYMAHFGEEPGALEVNADEPYMQEFGIKGQDAFLEMKTAKGLDARKLAQKRNKKAQTMSDWAAELYILGFIDTYQDFPKSNHLPKGSVLPQDINLQYFLDNDLVQQTHAGQLKLTNKGVSKHKELSKKKMEMWEKAMKARA
jgi:hypothetical protein